MTAVQVKKTLLQYASIERAKVNAWFFKTGKGQYGEGDEFIGVTVPDTRNVAKQFVDLPFTEIEKLLSSKKHEHRLVALLVLVERYRQGEKKEQKEIVQFYLANIEHINNWDLVDLSVSKILGAHYSVYGGEKKLLALVKSKNMWHRRIGIVATYAFIKKGVFEPTVHIAKILLRDKEDLIHKAVGWMLREVGKRDVVVLRNFLTEQYANMPRTMLRYAIEKFPEKERKMWLKRKL